MLKQLLAFLEDQSGAASLEYALMLALVTMGVLGSMETMGASVSDLFLAASNQLGDSVIIDLTDECRPYEVACEEPGRA